jgi:hypothetical protein
MLTGCHPHYNATLKFTRRSFGFFVPPGGGYFHQRVVQPVANGVVK